MEIIGRNQRERRIRFRDGALSYLCDICLLNVGLLRFLMDINLLSEFADSFENKEGIRIGGDALVCLNDSINSTLKDIIYV